MATGQQRQAQSKKDKWNTPEWLWRGIEQRVSGGIDLDPCAGPDTEIGDENWAIDRGEDGLEQSWEDYPIVFVNPPFSEKRAWVDKVVREYRHRNWPRSIFLVTPASPTVKSWFHGDRGDEYSITDAVDYIWFPSGRVEFYDPIVDEIAKSPADGTMVSIFGSLDIELADWMTEGEEGTPNDGGLVVEGVSV